MLDEALTYFGNDSGFKRLFMLFKQKYESLGRIGGTVPIMDFSDDELAAVARFFGMTASDLKQKRKVSLDSFEKQLHMTKFGRVQLKELIEAYFDEPLISKKERKQQQEAHLELFFIHLKGEFPRLTFWMDYLKRKSPDTYWIHRLIHKSEETFIRMVYQLDEAYRHLPNRFERLPMFSQRITSNPHAFDRNTVLGKLWIHVLAVNQSDQDTVDIPANSEAINDLLLSYKLLRDDITNYVTCANLVAETEEGLHPMWEAAAKTSSVMNVPLRELIPLTRVYPARAKKSIWVVENSGVYSSMLDQLPGIPLVCTHGQFKLAALLLIDLLADEQCDIYYAGDLDPEGIAMAERLLLRHPQHVNLWCMDVAAYGKSDATIELSNERLNKLDSITVPELIPLVEELKTRKKAGYQEALVEEMIKQLVEESYD